MPDMTGRDVCHKFSIGLAETARVWTVCSTVVQISIIWRHIHKNANSRRPKVEGFLLFEKKGIRKLWVLMI